MRFPVREFADPLVCGQGGDDPADGDQLGGIGGQGGQNVEVVGGVEEELEEGGLDRGRGREGEEGGVVRQRDEGGACVLVQAELVLRVVS